MKPSKILYLAFAIILTLVMIRAWQSDSKYGKPFSFLAVPYLAAAIAKTI
jgi:hypothetical protein